MEFYKSLFHFVSLSSLIFSCYAIPATRNIHDAPSVMAPSEGNILGDLFKITNKLGKNVDPTLNSICSSTTNPDLCVSTIAPFMPGGSMDPVKALEIEIYACLNHTKEMLHSILDLIGDRNTPKNMYDALDICKDNYDNILDDLRKAIDAFKNKDLGTPRIMLGSVMSMYGTCKDAFDETRGVGCPFSANSEKVYQLASNSLDISAIIKSKNN